jgi:hypothetical protein
MYRQVNPTELFRERQLALLKETDNRRLARRLRMARRTPKEGSLMRRTIMLMATMTLAVLAFGGVALAFNVIQCELTTCNGTPQADLIEGTPNSDTIDARGGNDAVRGMGDHDTIHGRGGFDDLSGQEGNDTLFGEGRGDFLEGEGDKNTYYGGPGQDNIDAAFGPAGTPANDGEEIFGGRGDDIIRAADGNVDFIACGPGRHDRVAEADTGGVDGIDADCEIRP